MKKYRLFNKNITIELKKTTRKEKIEFIVAIIITGLIIYYLTR
ncbi:MULTISPECIES: hypothetical protein [unclassified Gemella]|nr:MULTISPECIES: hypothetical protein [unclassified Gemella]